jgi:outer membrane protein assembly factor BamD
MNRWILMLFCLMAFAVRCPAPWVFTPGEGWHYEKVGEEGKWQRNRAKDQLDVAQAAFDQRDYGTALKAARRTVSVWPLSDYAPQGQYLLGRCYEVEGHDEKAFRAYQKLIEKYPKAENYEEVIKRQFDIANRFLAGQWFKAFGYVPLFPSMDKTIKMYEQIIKNGPYSDVAPHAQVNIGQAHERKRTMFVDTPDYAEAAKAYERAADRYAEQKVGVDALYQVGLAYSRQAKRAEYDQSIASHAISTFTDFVTLNPEEPRVSEAQKLIDSLKTEQARGSFDIARFYERNRKWDGAKIYYNAVVDALRTQPDSEMAATALKRIEAINKRLGQTAASQRAAR